MLRERDIYVINIYVLPTLTQVSVVGLDHEQDLTHAKIMWICLYITIELGTSLYCQNNLF